ncbi:MAG: ATP-binding cassette domain-containing protein [Butyrivibrio sp.]|nr:ATP-binding cassette domain-containing protein [Butyrivibrio sp.]
MSLRFDITKKLNTFTLEMAYASEEKRIGILGASGSGKSMTLKAIAGIVTPDKGYIRVEDRILFDSEKKVNIKTRNRNVGYLFQNYALFPAMSVVDNIASGIRTGSREEKRKTAREMAERFQLSGLEDRLPQALSGGQQQRVALARIMANAPDVILLDEPFSALDVYLKDRMQQELYRELESFNGTVILVSHDRDEIYRFSDAVLIVDKGRIVASGKTQDVFANPETAMAARLTGCKNISAATRIDAHTLRADDWGVTIRTRKEIPADLRHIGYRAHEFIPVWGDREENSIALRVDALTKLPFEQNCYVKPELETYGTEQILTWLIQRHLWPVLEEKGMPDYLRFAEAHLLFLK